MTPQRRADTLLAVTELVTNSLVHAGPGTVTVWAWLDAHRLRVEVHDAGPGIPADVEWTLPEGRGAGGRGLALVRVIADRCGSRREPWSMAWLEIDLAGNGRH